MQVDIWSDIVCPWCYVGKRRFETALASFDAADAVTVVYRSFQLNPAASTGETSDRREMLRRKYRLSDEQVEAMDARMTAVAAEEGLAFRLDLAGTGNTFDAHQLLHLAREHGRQEMAVDRLYRAYFSEGRSVFDRESLVALAQEAGLDSNDAADALDTRRYAAQVEGDIRTAQQLGATGVPFFVIDGRYGVSGAQSPQVFLEVLEKARG